MKSRWSKHKYDIRNSNWTVCGLTRHFGQYHAGDLEAANSALQVVLLDCCEQEEDLKSVEDRWICDFGTLFVGLKTLNEVLSNKRRNFGTSKPPVPHSIQDLGDLKKKDLNQL